MTDIDVIVALAHSINKRIPLIESGFDAPAGAWYTCTNDHVTRLSLRGCGLTELPDAICHLRDLQHLDITGNHLKTLPEGIGDLGTRHSPHRPD